MRGRKKTILIAVGTRPEAVKLFPVIRALQSGQGLRPFVLLSGQQEGVGLLLKEFGIRPDGVLPRRRTRGDLSADFSGFIAGFSRDFRKVRPDYALVQGDTLTALSAGMAAFFERIPFGHVEAGLRAPTKERPFPEEADRRILAVLADLHFAPSAEARKNLLRENISAERIMVTGNTGVDALRLTEQRLSSDPAFLRRIGDSLQAAGGGEVLPRRFVLVTCHRGENRGEAVREICGALCCLVRKHRGVEFVFVLHPNPAVADAVKKSLGGVSGLRLLPPLGYPEFVLLMKRALFVMTDSGGLQEEAPVLGKAVVLMREETERVEAVRAGAVVIAGQKRERIIRAAERFLRGSLPVVKPGWRRLYGTGEAGGKVARAVRRVLCQPGGGE